MVNIYHVCQYNRLIILSTQLEINRAPAIFMINPTRSILEKEAPLTPPNANPFTPVAIGLIKAHVQDSVMMISTSNTDNRRRHRAVVKRHGGRSLCILNAAVAQ